MFRYLALCWNPASPRGPAAAVRLEQRFAARLAGLKLLFRGAGVALYGAAAGPGFQVYFLSQGRGVILGRIFRRRNGEDAMPVPDVLDDGLTGLACSRGGRGLLEHFWGQYVAFLHDRSSGDVQLIRDPSGAIACYLSLHAGVSAAFSHLQDYASLDLSGLSINWRFVAARLVHPEPRSGETGLNEVTAIRPGEGVTLSGSSEVRREYHWGILGTAASGRIDDLETAAAAARRCIRECIAAWAMPFEHLLLHLSGGLDSSIVLNCLLEAASRPRVTCLNHFDQSAGGDERFYARWAVRGAAEKAGVEVALIEHERDPCHTQLRSSFELPISPIPAPCFGLLCRRHSDLSLAREKSPIFFTGQAGDAIFYRSRDASGAIDYVYHHGIGRRFARVAVDSARGEGTVWGVAASAIRRGLLARYVEAPFFRPRDMPLIPTDVLDDQIREAKRYCTPAWASSAPPDALRALSPDKLRHIDRMASPTWHLRDPLESQEGPYWFSPLASQPIVELFARIPLYVLTAEGQDRAVARRAFADCLPAPLLARRTKGLANRFLAQVVRRNEDVIRTTMLDGVLVKQRLLERSRLEELLSRSDYERSPDMSDVLCTHFDTEVWLRSLHGHFGRSYGTGCTD